MSLKVTETYSICELSQVFINMESTIPEASKRPMKATEGSTVEENKKALQFIEEVTINVDEVQKRVLAEILSRNANVEYLQRHDLNGHTDRETFKKAMPVITYEDIQPDINRIANGDKSPIFCSQPISEFLTSSGTSGGERKLIPTIPEEIGKRFQLRGLVMSVISQFVPDLEKGKGMYFWSIKSEAKTPGGLTARPVLTRLYRYRVGDVLRVAGYKNNAPQFYFICRENVILSIDSDKTDEAELQNAVKNAVHNLIPFDATVIEYTSYADTTTIPGHYVLFWELNVNGSTQILPSVFEDCCLTIEESLNSVYHQGRASDKSIGPLEIRIVEIGTFDKLMDYCVSLGASLDQYKTPRCVKLAPLVELLNSRVMSRHFSPTCPNWVPGNKQWNNMN